MYQNIKYICTDAGGGVGGARSPQICRNRKGHRSRKRQSINVGPLPPNIFGPSIASDMYVISYLVLGRFSRIRKSRIKRNSYLT